MHQSIETVNGNRQLHFKCMKSNKTRRGNSSWLENNHSTVQIMNEPGRICIYIVQCRISTLSQHQSNKRYVQLQWVTQRWRSHNTSTKSHRFHTSILPFLATHSTLYKKKNINSPSINSYEQRNLPQVLSSGLWKQSLNQLFRYQIPKREIVRNPLNGLAGFSQLTFLNTLLQRFRQRQLDHLYHSSWTQTGVLHK